MMERLTAFYVVREITDWNILPMQGELLVIDGGNGAKCLFLQCPCGCGSPIMVPARGSIRTERGDHPYWDITHEVDGTWSAAPSILLTSPDGCRSHFFIRHNRIDWC